MAISEDTPGIEVTVVVDGKVAEEYDVPHNLPNGRQAPAQPTINPEYGCPQVVKYIEGAHAAAFSICVTKESSVSHHGFHHHAYEIQLDDDCLDLVHEWRPEQGREVPQGREWKAVTSAYTSGNCTDGYQRHPFRFANLKIVPTGDRPKNLINEDMKKVESCGKLVVRIFHMRSSRREEKMRSSSPIRPTKFLCEKALEGKAIDLRFGQLSTPAEPPLPPLKNRYVDLLERPFVIFEFRYSSFETLIEKGIIPPPTIAQRIARMGDEDVRKFLQDILEQDERNQREQAGQAGQGQPQCQGPNNAGAVAIKDEPTENNNIAVRPEPVAANINTINPVVIKREPVENNNVAVRYEPVANNVSRNVVIKLEDDDNDINTGNYPGASAGPRANEPHHNAGHGNSNRGPSGRVQIDLR